MRSTLLLLLSASIALPARAQSGDPQDDEAPAPPPPQQQQWSNPQQPPPGYAYPGQYPYGYDPYRQPQQPPPYPPPGAWPYPQPPTGADARRPSYPPPYPPPQNGQFAYPGQYPYPYYAYPPQYPAPYPPAIPPQAVPPPAVPAPAPASPAPVAASHKLVLSTGDEGARTAALACADLLDHAHLDGARRRCREAIAKDDGLALAHLWLAEASASPVEAAAELAKAAERARLDGNGGAAATRVSRGEQLLVAGWRAWRRGRLAEADAAYDELVALLDGEPRAFEARGRFRHLALGDLKGAIADYERAAELDPAFAAVHNLRAFALADQGKLEAARAALRRYAELLPSEPNAHDSLAQLALRGGDPVEAAAEAKRALALDPRFLIARASLGDALLFLGRARDARREYGQLEASDDAALHHEGAMRLARNWLFEERFGDAERALVKEADVARVAGRAAEAAETFLEAAAAQIARGALLEAGRGIAEARASLDPAKGAKDPTDEAAKATAPTEQRAAQATAAVDEIERRELQARVIEARARALAALHERALAEARARELGALLGSAPVARAEARVRALEGWIASRAGDDKAAIARLEPVAASAPPTVRLALAQSLARDGHPDRARPILEELVHRTANDLETALARPRAEALLKTLPKAAPAATAVE